MSLLHLPAWVARQFLAMASWLHKKSAARLPLIFLGLLFASGRRTVTSWFRAAGIAADFRPAYSTVWAAGRDHDRIAVSVYHFVFPVLPPSRLVITIDDSPTSRYGPCIEGAGIHHNPTPGPTSHKYVYGHVWVTLAVLAKHKEWDCIALPLRGEMYIRVKNLDTLPPDHRPAFRTKLQMAAEQIAWLSTWAKYDFEEFWLVVDGGYVKRPVLKAAKKHGVVVVGRLAKNAALWCLPDGQRHDGQRGPLPVYGQQRIDLAKRAGHQQGWQSIQCRQYGVMQTKKVKTFLATWRPAGGVIRVVLVMEEDHWVAFMSTKADAKAEEILEAAADRTAVEQTFKDVKEVWGAAQQQVRNLQANLGCWNLNLWLYSLVEVWAWDQPKEKLVDRSASPWYQQYNRPSHQDKRRGLQRRIVREEIEEVLQGRPSKERIRELAERLLRLAC